MVELMILSPHQRVAVHIEDLFKALLTPQGEEGRLMLQEARESCQRLRASLENEDLPRTLPHLFTSNLNLSRLAFRRARNGRLVLTISNNLRGSGNLEHYSVHEAALNAVGDFLRSKDIRFKSDVLIPAPRA
ncbi:TPA: hypothetical protein HA244_04660 [Candidatus Micrarchaeota archaeon]|nr:hypothetical protein [Candidatus Micrarchaeota archaeon]